MREENTSPPLTASLPSWQCHLVASTHSIFSLLRADKEPGSWLDKRLLERPLGTKKNKGGRSEEKGGQEKDTEQRIRRRRGWKMVF